MERGVGSVGRGGFPSPLQWKRGFFHFLDSHRRVEGGNFLLSFMQPSYLDSQVSELHCVRSTVQQEVKGRDKKEGGGETGVKCNVKSSESDTFSASFRPSEKRNVHKRHFKNIFA